MKRADLTAGMAVYVDSRPDWETYGTGERAVVTDVRPHRVAEKAWASVAARREERHEPVEKGNGVLVDIDGTRRVVPLAHLRGSYAETAAHVEAFRVRRDEGRRAREQQADVERQRAHKVVEGLRALGYSSALVDVGRRVCLSVDDAERLHAREDERIMGAARRMGDSYS